MLSQSAPGSPPWKSVRPQVPMSSASPVKTRLVAGARTKLSDSGVWPGVSSTSSASAPMRSGRPAEAQRLAGDGAVAMHDRQRAGALGQLAAAGHVVGVHVRLDGVHEREAVRGDARQIALDLLEHGSMSAATRASSSPTR